MDELYTFPCLRCDRWTTPTTSWDDNQQLAEAEGWHWGKALVCPECRKKYEPQPLPPQTQTPVGPEVVQ